MGKAKRNARVSMVRESDGGGLFEGATVVHTYTRAQALADGVLVAADAKLAQEAGFKHPVAYTQGVYAKCVAVPAGCEGVQDVTGRAWDVLWMLRHAASTPGMRDRVTFKVSVVTGPRGRREEVSLWALCGPGDDGRPVITVMLEGED